MDFKEIQELIKLIGETGISEFKLEQDEFKLVVRNQKEVIAPQIVPVQPTNMAAPQYISPVQQPVAPTTTPTAEKAPSDNATPEKVDYLEIKSPIVGTFYRSSAPGKPAFVSVGDEVKGGDTVCIVEAMKLFNEIESEVVGKIAKIVVEDGSPVEYDQVLFLVEPNS